jgi:hypothetical protein
MANPTPSRMEFLANRWDAEALEDLKQTAFELHFAQQVIEELNTIDIERIQRDIVRFLGMEVNSLDLDEVSTEVAKAEENARKAYDCIRLCSGSLHKFALGYLEKASSKLDLAAKKMDYAMHKRGETVQQFIAEGVEEVKEKQ